MPRFVVRNLEDDVHTRLRAIALEQGQSMEDFVRELLGQVARKAAASRGLLGTRLASRFAQIGLEASDEIQEVRGQVVEPPHYD